MDKAETLLKEKINSISEENAEARAAAHSQWAACAHPLGGLGLLETAIEDMAALTGNDKINISNRCVLVLCADNGVVAQGISQCGSEVTGIVTQNLALRRTSVCRMAEVAKCKVVPVDMGIKNFEAVNGVASHRIGNGTDDISLGAAMRRTQAVQAINIGIELVKEQLDQGINLLATGEMGIGNTTTSSAVASVLLNRGVEEMTGRGAGLSNEGLHHKKEIIARAIKINQPDAKDPIDVLAKLGGYDIAGLCGVFLGGAIYRVPVLVDGFISAVAALCAIRLNPLASKAIFASHVSAEPAGKLVLEALGKKPLINAEMRLGEGTGAVAAIPLLDMACAVYEESYTFNECGVEAYQPLGGEA